jgi:hypothetical protein
MDSAHASWYAQFRQGYEVLGRQDGDAERTAYPENIALGSSLGAARTSDYLQDCAILNSCGRPR